MLINWFPGHMTKSLRMMDENIPLMDLLVYVLDARAPMACLNPAFSDYVQKLPVVYVLNKSDLADEEQTAKWLVRLGGEKSLAVRTDSTRSGSAKAVLAAAHRLCSEKLSKTAQKGVRRVLRCMVIGVPNCGKSTLINNICGKTKAYAENRAGVTRGKQWIRAGEYFEVLDTPGTLYPKIENQVYARHLAYIGSIRDEILDKYELACMLADELSAIYPRGMRERYAVTEGADCTQVLQTVAEKRGFRLKGGGIDEEKAAVAFIDDFRKGRLGKITLEMCDVNS